MEECLQSDGSRVKVARTRADMNIWLEWLAASLSLDKIVVSPCIPSTAAQGLLATGRGAETRAGHDSISGRNGEFAGYFFTATGDLSTHVHVNLGSHFYCTAWAHEKGR